MNLHFFCLLAGSASNEANKEEGSQSAGMGGAMGMISSSSMGMLSSLTSVVQSTVRTNTFMFDDDDKAKFIKKIEKCSKCKKKIHMLFKQHF